MATATTPTIAYISICDYDSKSEDELSLSKNEIVYILSKDTKISGSDGWWVGQNEVSQIGIIPCNFIVPVDMVIEAALIVVNELIGEGGFSKVYRGEYFENELGAGGKTTSSTFVVPGNDDDESDNSGPTKSKVEVAIKISKYDQDYINLLNEGKLNMKLKHENIIRFLGFLLNGAIVMEFSEGGNLADFLRLQNNMEESLDLSTCIEWGKQIAAGMDYLHENNIIHRDLKSSNVLIHTNEQNSDPTHKLLKITDFGLAREINHTTRMSTSGTFSWMSPEVIRCGLCSKSSDVWSYGVLLWELLTCEVPFKGYEQMTIAYGIAMNKLTLPIHQECPKEWRSLMEDCWNTTPSLRPTFHKIKTTLNNITQSNDNNFRAIQLTWRGELPELLNGIFMKEMELHSREEQMRSKSLKLKTIERQLKMKEIDLLQRELTLSLNPTPKKRRLGKFNKNLVKVDKLDGFISGPRDFRHTVKIQPITAPARSMSEAPQLQGFDINIKQPMENGNAEYFKSKRSSSGTIHSNGSSSTKYQSAPNLFKKFQKDQQPSSSTSGRPQQQLNKIQKIIVNIGSMFSSIVTRNNVAFSRLESHSRSRSRSRESMSNSTTPSPSSSQTQVNPATKYYTYHGSHSSKQRVKLSPHKYSTDV